MFHGYGHVTMLCLASYFLSQTGTKLWHRGAGAFFATLLWLGVTAIWVSWFIALVS